MATTTPAMAKAPFKIPDRHLAMVYDKPGTVSLRQETVRTPQPAHGQVLVRITHSGICHSDHGVMTHAWKWLTRRIEPGQVGGHEGVGHVVQLGEGTETSGLKLGDRVGIKWVSSACLTCPPCLDGADGCCLNLQISGYYTPGTFQQYTLAPACYATPIPEAVPSSVAAPLLCGGLTALAAMKKTNAPPGSWLLVAGAGGGVGHLVCQIAARAFGHRVVGVDSSSKEALARECGADEFISLEETHGGADSRGALVDEVRRLTGGLGVAAAIVCTGHLEAYNASLECLRFNGTLVAVGVQEGEQAPIQTASPNTFLFHQRRIVGTSVGNRKDAIEVMTMAAQGIIRPHFAERPLCDLPNIFHQMQDGKLLGKVVVQIPDTLMA